jgi:hypothetical protein
MEDNAMTSTGQATRKWTFTFGSDHTHPDTGQSLGHCYVQIEAASREAAREEMARLFGAKWAFQYDSPEKAGATKYNLREVRLPK